MNSALTRDTQQYIYDRVQQLRAGSAPDTLLFWAIRGLGSLRPLRARMRHIGGRIHYIRGDHAEAERWLLAALAAGRQDKASTHNYLGRSQCLLGKFADAEKHLQTAIDIYPKNDGYCLHMADTLRRQGKHVEEEPYLRQALKLRPNSAWTHFCLFQNARARHGVEQALDEWLDSALANPAMEDPVIHPDWWLVHRSAYTAERVEKARALLAQHPDAPDCHLLLAYLLRYSEHPADGVPHLQAASRRQWELVHGPGTATDFKTAKAPVFLVMGVAKSGSSSLYQYLCMHPLICRAMAKEINYWSDHHAAGPDWYQAFFPPLPPGARQISGEASIKTFWDPQAPERIAREAPDLKLILILREPVARAYSDYNMNLRLGLEARAWQDYVDEELAQSPRCPVDEEELPEHFAQDRNYLMKGAVLPILQRWLRHHDKRKILVVQNSDLGKDTTATMNRIFHFLGLPDHDIVAPPRMNVGGYGKQPEILQRRLENWYAPHQQALQAFLAREFP
ncbi:MAG: sulfotransferase domain-containing protein [Pseudomonadales bacterium]|nr:sulfotransferase domain-containing protein [Pseudomonadales bacterium]